MKNHLHTRISRELYDLLKQRKDQFGTSMVKESRNLVAITEEVSRKIGLDLKRVEVKPMPKLDFKKRVIVFK